MTEKKLEVIESEAKTRYRVGIVWQYLQEFTVYATSAQEATASVQEGFGRHAGASMPVVGEVLVKEIGGFDEAEYDAKVKEVSEDSDEVNVISDGPPLIVPPSGV